MVANHTLILLGVLLVLSTCPVRADEAAVRQAVAAYVEAFNNKDLKAVAGMWSAQATHTDRGTAERTEGRDAIVADIEKAFQEHPQSRLESHIDHVRFIKPDVAIVEGQTRIGAPDEPPASANFSAVLTQDDGKWVIRSIDETPVLDQDGPEVALRDLEWLVGHWVDESEECRVDTTIQWTESRAFLLRSYTMQTPEGESLHGTQVIGWDPRSRQIRSWAFNSDGSFGDATWSRNGDEWLIKSTQTLVDGRAASGTYVLSRTDSSTVTVRLVGHELEGEPQPSKPPVTMVRVADATPSPTATSSK